ncbi:VOC family protein [Parasporobacterium paucivorans]|uniref:Methylmalonyl-CoA/ethylmalonyl-CoA epimerase n=1 Tax=Parasporobacterium paucivorans DSM 15970 TaxID=1122934 RepID=A0A1M6E459_9FIRM|nr:VOC family protein [Parasporobacterium paucivorans]SHI80173.1 methylmalonyl-CoA/ethylmalonyl-CoA epimerase [Parasporobacterium paucivorans DSM 15970]
MEGKLKALHAGISVGDMDGAISWYGKNLGFRVVSDEYIQPLKSRIVFIKNGDFEIELFEHDDRKPIPQERLAPNSDIQTIGTKHIAFRVEDMKALKKKFLENGVDIAHEVTMGTDHVMFVRDNSGVLIEFIQN